MQRWMRRQFLRLKWYRFGVGIAGIFDFVNRSQYWPPERLREMRDAKLRRQVAHAYDEIPYYRRLLDDRGVRPEHIRGLEDLGKLPVMTKKMFHEHWDELRARDIPDDTVSLLTTGGTTGIPMPIAREWKTQGWQEACHARGISWGGLGLGDRSILLTGGSLGGGPPPRFHRLRQWLLGSIHLSAYELGSRDVIGEYAHIIRRSGARFLVGYASACYLLAMLTEQAGENLSFQAVFPTSELCPDAWAEAMARIFGARVLPFYGCGEVNSLGHSCPEGGGYHTCDEHAVIEVEEDSGRVGFEGDGAFLITDLDNRAVPFIRYRNGDGGRIAGPGCPCGRSLGRIVRLDGRVNDMLITTKNTRVSGMVAANAFLPIRGVEAFQVVQEAPGQATVRIVREPGYDAVVAEPQLRSFLHKFLGDDADIRIEYVSSIPQTRSGKRRFVINKYLAGGAAGDRNERAK